MALADHWCGLATVVCYTLRALAGLASNKLILSEFFGCI